MASKASVSERKALAAKVAHIRNATQTRHHTCHWPGCKEVVPPALWGCKRHWYLLPRNLREMIWITYQIGQEEDLTPSIAYLEVAREVQEWIANYLRKKSHA